MTQIISKFWRGNAYDDGGCTVGAIEKAAESGAALVKTIMAYA